MFQDLCYPLVQRLMAAEAMTEWWMCKGQPGNAATWQASSLALQRRLLGQAVTLRLFGVTGRPREKCHAMAAILAGYCKDVGVPHA